MKRNRVLIFLLSLLTFACASVGAQGQAATPSFTLTASDVTMPSSGLGLIPFEVTSVNGYTGLVSVMCIPQTPPAGANIPTCGAPIPYGNGFQGGGVAGQLTADSPVLDSVVEIYALPASISIPWNASLRNASANLQENGGMGEWPLAGALLVGLGFRRRGTRRTTRMLLALVILAGLTGSVGCVAPFPQAPTLTPGSYTYTVTAIGGGYQTSTTVKVTVPEGIVVL